MSYMEHLHCINFYPCMDIGDMIIYVTSAGSASVTTIKRYVDMREYASLAYDCYNDRRRAAASHDTFVCRQVSR